MEWLVAIMPFALPFGIVAVVLRHKYRMALLKRGGVDDKLLAEWRAERKMLEERIANLESIAVAHDDELKTKLHALEQRLLPPTGSNHG